jgi:hypothetical protein
MDRFQSDQVTLEPECSEFEARRWTVCGSLGDAELLLAERVKSGDRNDRARQTFFGNSTDS